MGIDYWNLKATVVCPHCGVEHEDDLQTHFLGDQSFLNYYRLGERVPELHGIRDAILDGVNDEFYSSCRACRKHSRFGAHIVDEAVVELFPLPDEVDTSN
jgi:hypothetical protein